MSDLAAHPRSISRLLEWVLATIGAFNCIIVSVAFAQSKQPMFPLPGLYLLEIAMLGLIVTIYVGLRPRLGTQWVALPWLAAGIILAFVVLGGFSIGSFLIPALLAFAATGVVGDLQAGTSSLPHLGILLIAAVAQAAIMALFILLT